MRNCFSIVRSLVSSLLTLVTVALTFHLPLPVSGANEAPQTVTLDGVLYQKGSTTPLLDSAARLKVQIISANGNCLLYEEEQVVNTSSTKGYFNIQVGSALASPKRTVNDSGNLMSRVFQNMISIPAQSIPGQTCAGLTHVPTAGEVRYFRITVTPSTTNVADVLTPDIVLDSVPQAIVAQSLQGLERSQVLAANTAGGVSLSQASLEAVFTGTAYTNLQSILNGNFMRTDTSGATLPAYASNPAGLSTGDMWYDSTTNQIKYQSNTGVQTLGTSTVTGDSITSGTISGSTSINSSGNLVTTGTVSGLNVQATNLRVYNGSNYVQFTAAAMSSSYSLTLPTSGGSSGQVLTTNGSGALTWTTPASGISGTLPVNQGGTGATSFAANRIIASNGTGSALQNFSCSLNQVISFDASGNATCQNVSSLVSAIQNGGNSTGAAISIGTNDNQAMFFKTNNTAALTISQNGFVGIGTTSPNSSLDLIGSSVASGNAPMALSVVGGNTNSGAVGTGGGITLAAGGRTATSAGGVLTLSGGNQSGLGGNANLTGGAGGNGSAGGSVVLTGGTSSNSPGSISIGGGVHGASTNGTDIAILPGAKSGTGSDGNILLASTRGNVGIATSTPDHLLTVRLPAQNVNGVALKNSSGTSTIQLGDNWGAGNLLVKDESGVTKVRINGHSLDSPSLWIRADSGNITDASYSSHRTGLYLQTALPTGSENGIFFSNSPTGGHAGAAITHTITDDVDYGRGSLNLKTSNAGVPTTRLSIDSLGNVGIGTTSPTSKLHVSGGAIVAESVSNATAFINFNSGNVQVTNTTATTINVCGLKDGGAYTLILTGVTASSTVTINGFTNYVSSSSCAGSVTVDLGAGATTFTSAGNTNIVSFIYTTKTANGNTLFGSTATNFNTQ